QENIVTFNDSLGNIISVSEPENVAACSGSLAEIWLLAGGELGGVTQDAYDEHLFEIPDTVTNLGAMKSPSIEIMISEGIDFAIFSSKIAEHCELQTLLNNAGITAAYFDIESFKDYLEVLKIFTGITGRSDLYTENGESVQDDISKTILTSKEKEPPTVLYIRAFSTGAKAKGADTIAGKMLSDLGCKNIVDESPSLLEDLSIEKIIELDPDFIFVTTMGNDEEKALQALKNSIQSNPAWSELTAVKSDRYIVLPKALYHYKPNARWGEAYNYLAGILYEQ
ncbi:MAG: ABC transporter substrate-binding protein, partial [Oscillospiraceae bacterium]